MTYDYQCSACAHCLEAQRPAAERELPVPCPVCGAAATWKFNPRHALLVYPERYKNGRMVSDQCRTVFGEAGEAAYREQAAALGEAVARRFQPTPPVDLREIYQQVKAETER